MVVLGGVAISYERGTPVIDALFSRRLLLLESTSWPVNFFSSFLLLPSLELLSSLELSDTKVYEP